MIVLFHVYLFLPNQLVKQVLSFSTTSAWFCKLALSVLYRFKHQNYPWHVLHGQSGSWQRALWKISQVSDRSINSGFVVFCDGNYRQISNNLLVVFSQILLAFCNFQMKWTSLNQRLCLAFVIFERLGQFNSTFCSIFQWHSEITPFWEKIMGRTKRGALLHGVLYGEP